MTPTPPMEKYVVGKQVGRGAYGRVFQLERKSDGAVCVDKQVGVGKALNASSLARTAGVARGPR